MASWPENPRLIGKYIEVSPDSETRAEDALRRALALSPHLTVAHKFYANLEADIGQAQRAMVRLLAEADRHGNDPELYVGLVHACRYCGLNDQSIAAHFEARRLDPNIPTSFEQTLLMTADIDRLLSVQPPPLLAGADDGIRVVGPGGANPGYFRAAVRETIGKFVSWFACFLGFLWMLWDPQQQTWHDKICGTTVVRA